jgi:type IV pilus assembly protein PilV
MNSLRLRESGFNLVEVLVAVAVLAIGLLGIAALQINGIRYNLGSYSRSVAVMIANDYAERMYAARPSAAAGLYGNFDSSGADCDAAPAEICAMQSDNDDPVSCSGLQMATYDQFVAACGYPTDDVRHGGVVDLLPQGQLVVTCVDDAGAAVVPCGANRRHRITVSWQERETGDDGLSTVQTLNYSMTVLP